MGNGCVNVRYEGCDFKAALTFFLLELGTEAAERVRDLLRVGPTLLAFGTIVRVVHGVLGAVVGTAIGMSVGGSTILAAMAASASYIAAGGTGCAPNG